MLKAIFFDIDNTLFSTREFAARARAASVEAMIAAGLRIDAVTLLAELEEVVREFSSNHEKHFDKLLLRLPRRVTKGLNPSLIVAAGIVAYHQTKFRSLEPFEDAYEVLRRLARTDLVRGVITEGLEVKQAEKLVRLRVHEFLTPHAIFISHQMGISKPNPKLYQRACGDLNLRPAECMYVGDSPELDIDPANAVGMVTVRILREGSNRDDRGATEPDHEVENFWDLAEILARDYEVGIPEEI
jgi:putative hydrolase of the HAD superfamily